MGPELVVLAAGMRSRYGGLKQIDPIGPNGETIIDYSIFDAKKAGFKKVVFIIRKDIEADFIEHVGKKFEGIIEVAYAFQEIEALPKPFTPPEGRKKPWGTGHAILMAKEHIHHPFLVINGDDFYGQQSFKIAADYLSEAKDRGKVADFMMVGFSISKTLSENGTVSRGICKVNTKDCLSEVVEHTQIGFFEGILKDQATDTTLEEHAITSMNMFGFTPTLFQHLENQFTEFLQEKGKEEKSEFYIPSVVNRLIQEQSAEVKVLHSRDQWYGVTYREDKPSVKQGIETLIKAGTYPTTLF